MLIMKVSDTWQIVSNIEIKFVYKLLLFTCKGDKTPSSFTLWLNCSLVLCSQLL